MNLCSRDRVFFLISVERTSLNFSLPASVRRFAAAFAANNNFFSYHLQPRSIYFVFCVCVCVDVCINLCVCMCLNLCILSFSCTIGGARAFTRIHFGFSFMKFISLVLFLSRMEIVNYFHVFVVMTTAMN